MNYYKSSFRSRHLASLLSVLTLVYVTEMPTFCLKVSAKNDALFFNSSVSLWRFLDNVSESPAKKKKQSKEYEDKQPKKVKVDVE